MSIAQCFWLAGVGLGVVSIDNMIGRTINWSKESETIKIVSGSRFGRFYGEEWCHFETKKNLLRNDCVPDGDTYIWHLYTTAIIDRWSAPPHTAMSRHIFATFFCVPLLKSFSTSTPLSLWLFPDRFTHNPNIRPCCDWHYPSEPRNSVDFCHCGHSCHQ